jgi:hypothetical protein
MSLWQEFNATKNIPQGLKPTIDTIGVIPGINPRPTARLSFPQGLKRLRKKAGFQAKCPKSIPQGLKPSLIPLALCRR